MDSRDSLGRVNKDVLDAESDDLLREKCSEDDVERSSGSFHRLTSCPRRRHPSLIGFTLIQAALLVLYSLGAVLFVRYSDHITSSLARLPFNPARSAIRMEAKTIDGHLFEDNPFKGPPSPEVDAAWDSLFSNAYVRLSSEELRSMNQTSTPIQDGSGDFLGSLDMYHQLHCVRYIHQYIHPEYYTLPTTNINVKDHVAHCVDMVRQVVMCHADPTVMTFTYHPDHPIAWPQFRLTHECRNWDALDAWSGDSARRVDSSRLNELSKNPDFVGGVFNGHDEQSPANEDS